MTHAPCPGRKPFALGSGWTPPPLTGLRLPGPGEAHTPTEPSPCTPSFSRPPHDSAWDPSWATDLCGTRAPSSATSGRPTPAAVDGGDEGRPDRPLSAPGPSPSPLPLTTPARPIAVTGLTLAPLPPRPPGEAWPVPIGPASKSGVAAAGRAALDARLRRDLPAVSRWFEAASTEASFRLSRLEGSALPPLWVTSTLIQGGFGKFRLGLDGGRAGDPVVAVKESRLTRRYEQDAPKRSGKRGPLTCFISEADLCRELEAAQLITRLSRPERAYDVDGKIYVTQGLMPCTVSSAVQRLAERATPDERGRAAFYLFLVGCERLADFHATGWVHGDIKPANMLLTPTGDVEFADCGLAQRLGPDGLAHDVTCTVAYAAPELFGRAGVAGTADVWSLGASCLEGMVPSLREGPDRQRRRGDFVSSLLLLSSFMPRFAALLYDQVFAASPAARLGAHAACRTLHAWPECAALRADGQATWARVAEPDPQVEAARAVLEAHAAAMAEVERRPRAPAVSG